MDQMYEENYDFSRNNHRDLELDPVLVETYQSVKVSKVAFDFILHFLLAFMFTVWSFIIMSIVLRNEPNDPRDGSSRPLVDDEDLSEFEDGIFGKQGDLPESRVIPENGEDSGNANESVTNFGI